MICGKVVVKFQSGKSVYSPNGFVTKHAVRKQKVKQEVGISVDNLDSEELATHPVGQNLSCLTWPDSDQSPRTAAPLPHC